MTAFIRVSTSAGRGELIPVPAEFTGETAIDTCAKFLTELARQQTSLPPAIRAFRPPLTIEFEEVAL